MMALAGVELETLVSEPDALTTQPQFANPSLLHLFPAKQVLQSGLSSYSLNRDHVRNNDLSNEGVSTHLM